MSKGGHRFEPSHFADHYTSGPENYERRISDQFNSGPFLRYRYMFYRPDFEEGVSLTFVEAELVHFFFRSAHQRHFEL